MLPLKKSLALINPYRSFRTRLGLAIASIALLFSLLLCWIIGHTSKAYGETDKGKFMAQLAYQMAEDLDRGMFSYFREVEILASLDAVRNFKESKATQRALLEKLQQAYTDYAWIGLTDDRGLVLASTQKLLEEKDVSERPWFIEGQKTAHVRDVHEAKLLGKMVANPSSTDEPLRFVDISSPVFDRQGIFEGVLGAHLYWQWATKVRDLLLGPLQDYHKVEVLIVSSSGEVLLAPNLEGKAQNSPSLAHLKSFQSAQQAKTSYLVETWVNGQSYLTGFAKTKGFQDYTGLGWVVLVRQPVNLAFADARSLSHQILVWGLLLGGTSGAVSWWIAGYLCAPLMAIAATAQRIRQGDKNAKIPVILGQDEVAMLSNSIRSLVLTLNEQKHSLATLNSELEQKVNERTASLKRVNEQLSQEIEERKQAQVALSLANQELQRLTIIDGLTGVANRRHFDQYLQQEWHRLAREKSPLSLILVDVDYFKRYNDTYGHQAGDTCLQQVARAIQETLKRPADLVARYGGEEFAVILPNTDEMGAICVAKAITEAVKALQIPHRSSAVSDRLTLSLGVATIVPTDQLDYSMLIASADRRLYQAKEQGRDRAIANETLKMVLG